MTWVFSATQASFLGIWLNFGSCLKYPHEEAVWKKIVMWFSEKFAWEKSSSLSLAFNENVNSLLSPSMCFVFSERGKAWYQKTIKKTNKIPPIGDIAIIGVCEVLMTPIETQIFFSGEIKLMPEGVWA